MLLLTQCTHSNDADRLGLTAILITSNTLASQLLTMRLLSGLVSDMLLLPLAIQSYRRPHCERQCASGYLYMLHFPLSKYSTNNAVRKYLHPNSLHWYRCRHLRRLPFPQCVWACRRLQDAARTFVFIQGGGFNSEASRNLNGAGLIEAGEHDMMVVSCNYRVSLYGFLTKSICIIQCCTQGRESWKVFGVD